MPRKSKKAEEAPAEEKESPKKGAKAAKSEGTSTQPEVSIGLVGHVDHGKTTLTEKLSGKWTDTHSEELKRGITIRLGYADSTFHKCSKCKGSKAYSVFDKCPECSGVTKPLRKVSFVDAPGHESLMATMLAGSAIIDGALLLIAANEECPQPQTREHLMALEIIGIENVVVIQNKIDLVTKEVAIKNYKSIKEFLKGTKYENAPVIPVSAQHGVNIDLLIETIENVIPTPKRDDSKEPIMFVARSFDINKPGSKVEKTVGGILGGSLKQGVIKVGSEIEIKPGHGVEEKNQIIYKSIKTKVTGIMTGNKLVDSATPGGSIALMTSLDPGIVKSDRLAGAVVGLPEQLPIVWQDITLETALLKRVVGAKDDLVVEPIKMGEMLMLNVNSAATVGTVYELSKKILKCKLKLPVCAEVNSRMTISRRIGNRWRLIGYGIMKE